MEQQPYIVYAMLDDSGVITDVNSGEFIENTVGWVEIDRGYTQRHHHAQGNYFDKPIRNEHGICRYKLENGQIVERTAGELAADAPPDEPKFSDRERIEALEEELAATKILLGITE